MIIIIIIFIIICSSSNVFVWAANCVCPRHKRPSTRAALPLTHTQMISNNWCYLLLCILYFFGQNQMSNSQNAQQQRQVKQKWRKQQMSRSETNNNNSNNKAKAKTKNFKWNQKCKWQQKPSGELRFGENQSQLKRQNKKYKKKSKQKTRSGITRTTMWSTKCKSFAQK